MEKDKKKLCAQMTLEEKSQFVNGASFFGMSPIDRLEIPRVQFLDGGTGINFEQLFGDIAERAGGLSNSTNGMAGQSELNHVITYFYEPDQLKSKAEQELYDWMKEQIAQRLDGREYAPGCYPAGMMLGATWNPDIVEHVGEALGKEARLYKIDVLLGTPNVNIHRAVLNGRLFEGYSEDPCLVAKLAPCLVKGVQSQGVAANVKHFAANNQETNRVGINEIISERALEEIYYPGFKACVKEGKVHTVMSAYNRINGVPCTESYQLLTEKLRKEWGFDGVVLSDWGAVYHPVEALAAGNDLAMPGPISGEPIVKAVQEKRLSEEQLDQAVIRLLNMLENTRKAANQSPQNLETLIQETDKAAYDAACEGIVLLENDGILPLAEQSAALTGSGAVKLAECGSGSAGITTDRVGNLKECLQHVRKITDTEKADIIIHIAVCNGMEGNDRTDMQMNLTDLRQLYQLGAIQEDRIPTELLEQIKENNSLSNKNAKPVILVLNVCGPVDLSFLNQEVVRAILCIFIPGMGGAQALADVLNGSINPSGKLPLTFPVHYENSPAYLNFPGDGYEVFYGEGIYVGYRYYDKKKVDPLYPFGYGLSYTQFEISKIANMTVLPETGVSFTVSITNIGEADGAEVIQIYVSDPFATLGKPVKELKAFQKVFLKRGESRSILFDLKLQDFASYDQDLHQFTVEEGYYDIHVAVSSAQEDIVTSERIYLDVESPYSYGIYSTVKTLYENSSLHELLVNLWNENGWDLQIVESNYEYTSNKTLKEILPSQENESLHKFLDKVKKVKKK